MRNFIKFVRAVTSAMGVYFGTMLVVYALFGQFSRLSLAILMLLSAIITLGLWWKDGDGDG